MPKAIALKREVKPKTNSETLGEISDTWKYQANKEEIITNKTGLLIASLKLFLKISSSTIG